MSEQNGYENFNEDYAYQTVMKDGKPKTRVWSVISIVIGIVSVVCCCFGWVGLVLGILAIVFSIVSRSRLGYFDGLAIAGLVLGVFGTVFGLVFAITPYIVSDEKIKENFEKFLDAYYKGIEG